MREILITAGTWVVLVYLVWRVRRWAGASEREGALRWRRRLGVLFFAAPLLLWIGEVILPESAEWVLGFLQFMDWVNLRIEAGIEWLLEASSAHVPWLIRIAVEPVAYAIAYSLVGVIVGWPLDRLRAKRAPAGEADGTVEL